MHAGLLQIDRPTANRTSAAHKCACLALLALLPSASAAIPTPPWSFVENMLRPTPYMPAASPHPKEWSDQRITVTWIGHATVLINFYGTTILTDPVLVKRLAPPNLFGMNLGIRRITQLPLHFDDLPPIDLVLLSHAHYDHWDLATLKRFKRNTQLIIPRFTSDLVPEGRFRESHRIGLGT